ncbi:MAG: hypothetical protein Fur002_16120 [Anaerolineales bacterium]
MLNSGALVALVLILIVVGANALMFAAVRGAFRGDVNFFGAIHSPLKKDGEMSELRRRVQALDDEDDESDGG